MNKLLKFLDDHLLRFGVAFAILFTALYPKLPSIHVERTWVYIRLEDFVILSLAVIWFIQLLRKKVSLPKPEGYALILYWAVGLISLIYCLIFIAPQLANFFPTIAGLQFARRIEYMILFFIAFSTVKNVKHVYFYLTTLCITVLGIVIYGFGQRFYLTLWKTFPDFFEKNPFCFPAFLTGNEEFAKGIPLCLTETSRVSSTFGGHYDLAAYLVFVIPILIALFFGIKRWALKIPVLLLALLALEVLNFTSSRTSFAAYVVGIVGMFILWNRKRWIIPVLVVSIGVMLLSSDATIARFAKTVQPVQVISTDQELPSDLKDIIAKTKELEENKKPEVPPASDFTVGDKSPASSVSSGFTTVLTEEQLKKLRASDDIAISTVSGSFLIKKAYALDISFTTRFQAEWPRNWKAFLYSPLLGTGYSSLTLATDNDYLRALGETGLLGLLAFLFIFVVLGIFMKNTVGVVKESVVNAFLFGLAGGVIGLLVNATLIDVFEASKVAEPMWMLLGIGVGAGYLYKKHTINYKQELYRFFTSRIMIPLYLLLLMLVAFGWSIPNFFVADDFTWLKWAATAELKDVPMYFISAQDFFYRPIDKSVVFFLYQLFSFQPEGYHIFSLTFHFLNILGVYYLAKKLFKTKLLGFLTAVIFALHPVHHENVYWFSTISGTLSTFFIVYAVLAYLRFREHNSILFYIVTIILALCAFLTYEIAVALPLLLIAVDVFIIKPKRTLKSFMLYIPFGILIALYFVIRWISRAFSGGGDYSYSMFDLPMNFIGNFIGYTMLFLGGNNALPAYSLLRESLRTQIPLVLTILVLVLVIVVVGVLYWKKKLLALYKEHYISLGIFGVVFAAISLMPFLGLGNIAPRYNYLAIVGYSVALIAFLQYLFTAKSFIFRRRVELVMVIIVTLLSIWYICEDMHMAKEWWKAGDITKTVLKVFRTDYESFSNNTQVYFVDAPLRYHDTWLFPVGLNDALWFIYRDRLPAIHNVKTVKDAKDLIKSRKTTENFIFRFNKDGKLVREL